MNSHYSACAVMPALAPYPPVPKLSLATQRMLLRIALVLSDALALAVAFGIGYWVRFDLRLSVSPDIVPDPSFYPHLVAILIPLFVVVFGMFGLYRTHVLMGGVMEYSRVFHACATATMVVIIVTFISQRFVVSRLWLVSAWLLSFLIVAISRVVCRRLAYLARERGYLLVRAVIVGTNQ
jgi:FlaA1/EpsC-like NDP-sugar epimerase